VSWWVYAAFCAVQIFNWVCCVRLVRRLREARQRNVVLVGIAERALARADFCLYGTMITLKWAGVDDIPGGVDRGTDPRGGVEDGPHDGMEDVPEVQAREVGCTGIGVLGDLGGGTRVSGHGRKTPGRERTDFW
jgi:hypothetical protein